MHYGVVSSRNDLTLTCALGVNSSDEKWNGVESYNFNGNETMNPKLQSTPHRNCTSFSTYQGVGQGRGDIVMFLIA